MGKTYKYTVCTQCFTYNQASYILDTLNGFVAQRTDFPVIYTIVDDASTDNEPQILQDYLCEFFSIDDSAVAYREETDYGIVLYAQHKVNKNCYFVVTLLKENHYSQGKSKYPYISRWRDNAKYIALCEGDDYWTDPSKLQTQVDFLDEHKDYSLCCHRYRIYNQECDSWEDDYVHALFERHPNGFAFSRSDNLKTWITKTVTLMYRADWDVMGELQRYKYRCDEHLNYLLLSHGPGYCFPFIGAVYRRTDSGVFAPLSAKTKRLRGVLIRSELLANNLEDNDLKEDVYFRIKECLHVDHSLNRLMRPIGICLKSYYLTEGHRGGFRIAKKLLGSYLKGIVR